MAGADDKDHVFFADMLALFKDKLSIDTSRVFCCGFSFGAMVTYSLSLDFQKDLRAVACYAPAIGISIFPTNKHEPLAFYQHDRHRRRPLQIRSTPMSENKAGNIAS